MTNLIAAAIAEAEVITASAPPDASQNKPRLLVESSDPDRTVAALRNILADAGLLFDRGVPVRLTFDQIQGGAAAQIMSPDGLVLMAHTVCRPYALKQQKDGTIKAINVRLPRVFAVMYLDWRGEWRLPLLNGIASAPLLREDGTIFCAQGYDAPSGMWLENVPDLADAIPDHPTRGQAQAALHLLRETFKTFCFADAASDFDAATGLTVVDTNRPPGRDEFAFLVGLLTAVCRPSLHLAPGVLLRAAPLSGAGAGKGLLARCISMIAFGHEPYAVTGGGNAEELEKRIASELIAGGSALFLDNMNNTALKSDLLASAITERPARVRVLGRSQMVPLNASAFIILTGNGLTVSEDLARRFIAVEFDPGTEDPEFAPLHDRHPGCGEGEEAGTAFSIADYLALGTIRALYPRAKPSAASSSGPGGCAIPCSPSAARTLLSGSARPRSATAAARASAIYSRPGGRVTRTSRLRSGISPSG